MVVDLNCVDHLVLKVTGMSMLRWSFNFVSRMVSFMRLPESLLEKSGVYASSSKSCSFTRSRSLSK